MSASKLSAAQTHGDIVNVIAKNKTSTKNRFINNISFLVFKS